MYHKYTQRCLQLLLLGSLLSLTHCYTEVNQEQVASQKAADDVEVTSFNIERKDSPTLANWITFEDAKERICTPPGWKSYITSQRELVIIPPDSKDSTERIGFSRFDRDSNVSDYDTLALNMTEAAFKGFRVQKADTLKKLVFQQDFGYERNTELLLNGLTYKGYCIVYVDDSLAYKFRIILSDSRLHNYKGSLFSDIIGNIQINKHYIMDNNNPLKNFSFIK